MINRPCETNTASLSWQPRLRYQDWHQDQPGFQGMISSRNFKSRWIMIAIMFHPDNTGCCPKMRWPEKRLKCPDAIRDQHFALSVPFTPMLCHGSLAAAWGRCAVHCPTPSTSPISRDIQLVVSPNRGHPTSFRFFHDYKQLRDVDHWGYPPFQGTTTLESPGYTLEPWCLQVEEPWAPAIHNRRVINCPGPGRIV